MQDESVLVAVEGPENEVNLFLGAIKMELSTYIREVTCDETIALRALGPGFEIRY